METYSKRIPRIHFIMILFETKPSSHKLYAMDFSSSIRLAFMSIYLVENCWKP